MLSFRCHRSPHTPQKPPSLTLRAFLSPIPKSPSHHIFYHNRSIRCVLAESLQSCLTVCDPMDLARQAPLSMGFSRQEHWSGLPCPPPGDFPDSGIKPRSPALQVDSLPTELSGNSLPFLYILLIACAVSCCCRVSHVQLCDPVDLARQAPLSMGFSRQEYWSEQPFPSPGDLPDPGIKPRSPTLQADSLPS